MGETIPYITVIDSISYPIFLSLQLDCLSGNLSCVLLLLVIWFTRPCSCSHTFSVAVDNSWASLVSSAQPWQCLAKSLQERSGMQNHIASTGNDVPCLPQKLQWNNRPLWGIWVLISWFSMGDPGQDLLPIHWTSKSHLWEKQSAEQAKSKQVLDICHHQSKAVNNSLQRDRWCKNVNTVILWGYRI